VAEHYHRYNADDVIRDAWKSIAIIGGTVTTAATIAAAALWYFVPYTLPVWAFG
jgi:hypothetical protein